jgi:hypothetical protein
MVGGSDSKWFFINICGCAIASVALPARSTDFSQALASTQDGCAVDLDLLH